MGPRAGLDRCGKSRPHRNSIPRTSSPQPVAILTKLSDPTKELPVTNKAVWWFTLLFCIWEVFGSTVGSQTDYFSEHLFQFASVTPRTAFIIMPTNILSLLSM